MSNTKIFTIIEGFYFFGTEVSAKEGFVALKNAAMFGSFGGGKGVPGVSRGDKKSTVTLDRFDENQELVFPITSVVAILPSIDLYTFSGTTLR